MTDADWNAPRARVLGVCLNGQIDEFDERGRPISGTTLLFFFSAEDCDIRLRLPQLAKRQYWHPVFDTARSDKLPRRYRGASYYTLSRHSCVAFELRRTLLKAVQQLFARVAETMPRPPSN